MNAQEVPCRLVEKVTPVNFLKSIKHAAEIDGLREAHIRDGVAMCKFIAWIEGHMRKGTPGDPVLLTCC
jgi:Xaa-Pro aminopeptidase